METQENVRQAAIAYVETVVARAEGAPLPEPASERPRPALGRLVPGSVKRTVIRSLIKLNRHPFDHLSHPLRVEFEHQVAELRAGIHAANRRADQAYASLGRVRPELDVWRRTLEAAIRELEDEVRALRARVDELESRR